MPLLLNGELWYGGNIVVVIMPFPQIFPSGTRVIVESHLVAINGHQHSHSNVTSMIMNASAALSLSDALALLDSLEGATGNENATFTPVRSRAPPWEVFDGYANSLSLTDLTFLNMRIDLQNLE
jgi:hypothetical protein